MKLFAAAAAIVVFVFALSAQDTALRNVKGRVIKSTQMPSADLEFGKGFKYIGGHRFVLYEVANAEQHFFVDAGKDGLIKRLYWVQFEGYLPTNTRTYNYKQTKLVTIGGLDFVADALARNMKAGSGRPDSDGARAQAFLVSKGFKFAGDDLLTQRFVHMVDDKKRDELMIIYLEDMSGLALTAADVAKGGKAEAKWPEISEALLARAQKDIKIRRRK